MASHPSLPHGYSIRPVEAAEFADVFLRREAAVFPERQAPAAFDVPEFAQRLRKERQNKRSTEYRLRWLVEYEGQCVGWTWGLEYDPERFYMVNSAIEHEHRRKGLYTALLQHVIDEVQSQGFGIVFSRHVATNNAVIIPKLRAGFVITGMELHERFGFLVVLSKFLDAGRQEAVSRVARGGG